MALSIGAIILTGAMRLLPALVSANKRAKVAADDAYLVARSHAILSSSMELLDTHRFNIPPRIHRLGRITYRGSETETGGPHAIMSHKSLSPSDNDAVTFMGLTLAHTRAITKITTLDTTPNATTLQVNSCPRFTTASSYRRFVLVTPHHLHEAILLEPAIIPFSGCSLLTLAVTRSVSLEPPPTVLANNIHALLVPIEHHFTLYVDKHRRLRLLNHYGGRTVENQPMLEGVERLELELTSLPGDVGAIHPNLYLLAARITPSKSKPQTIRISHAVEQRGHLNFLLNELKW